MSIEFPRMTGNAEVNESPALQPITVASEQTQFKEARLCSNNSADLLLTFVQMFGGEKGQVIPLRQTEKPNAMSATEQCVAHRPQAGQVDALANAKAQIDDEIVNSYKRSYDILLKNGVATEKGQKTFTDLANALQKGLRTINSDEVEKLLDAAAKEAGKPGTSPKDKYQVMLAVQHLTEVLEKSDFKGREKAEWRPDGASIEMQCGATTVKITCSTKSGEAGATVKIEKKP